jgi:hypothetical protein
MLINYIPVFYFGKKRFNNPKDIYFFLKKHLEFVSSLDSNSNIEVTFVINKRDNDDINKIESIISQYSFNVPFEILYRENYQYSYGGWNYAIKRNLQKNYDYSFLIEDDYIPTSANFYEPFLEKMDEDVAYVCTKVFEENEFGFVERHAAISNGLISNKKCMHLLRNNYVDIFYLREFKKDSYISAERHQMKFLDYFIDLKFKLKDIDNKFEKMFFDGNTGLLNFGGNEKGPIVPIVVDKKILILMAYYNRPNIVKNALESIKNQNYDNWELAFVDDGSDIPGKEIVEDILKDNIHKVKFFNTNSSRQDKELSGGSVFGFYWNKAMYNSDADIAIMLCDDDALYPDYFKHLNDYYQQNENVIYSYGHVAIFDPYNIKNFNSLINSKANTDWMLNKINSINPENNLDASQVSWRIKNIVENKITFPFIRTANLDAFLYKQLYNFYHKCVFNGIIVQYKGVHPDQLGNRVDDPYTTKEMNDRII